MKVTRHLAIKKLLDHGVSGSNLIDNDYNIFKGNLKKYEVYTFHQDDLDNFFSGNHEILKVIAGMIDLVDMSWNNFIHKFNVLLLGSTLFPQRDMVTGDYKGFYLVFTDEKKQIYTVKIGIDENDIYNYKGLGAR